MVFFGKMIKLLNPKNESPKKKPGNFFLQINDKTWKMVNTWKIANLDRRNIWKMAF